MENKDNYLTVWNKMLKLEWLTAINEERTEALITGNFVTNILDTKEDSILIKSMLIANYLKSCKFIYILDHKISLE
jgi:hypothetical protein